MAIQNPKLDWKAGDVLLPSDLNRIEENIYDLDVRVQSNTNSINQLQTALSNLQQIITPLYNRYGHLSGQLQVAQYEVTNLLGSYGSFSVDSDGDGLADGWRQYYESITNIMDGIQYVEHTLTSPITVLFDCRLGSDVQTNNYVFARRKIKTQTSAPTHGGLGAMLFYQPGMNTFLFYGAIHNDFTNQYTSAKMLTTYSSVSLYLTQEWVGPQAGTYKMWIDNVILVNLTTMGELPQALKQFFSPSNITKWEDLAIFGTTNVMCILKDANGNYITKNGNDWLNDLIPYVENTATVWMPVYL